MLLACPPPPAVVAKEHGREVERTLFVSTLAWELLRNQTPDGGPWYLKPDAGAPFAREHEAAFVLEAQPAGCAQATGSGDVIGLSFTDCTAPLSAEPFSGTASIALDMVGAENWMNQGTLTGTIDHRAFGRLTLARDLSFGTAHGEPIGTISNASNSERISFSWSAICHRYSGALDTGVFELRSCGHCPTGKSNLSGLTSPTELVFDGSQTARWSSSGDESGTVALSCTP